MDICRGVSHVCGCLQRPEESIGSLQITGDWETLNVSAENWTWVLCKSSDAILACEPLTSSYLTCFNFIVYLTNNRILRFLPRGFLSVLSKSTVSKLINYNSKIHSQITHTELGEGKPVTHLPLYKFLVRTVSSRNHSGSDWAHTCQPWEAPSWRETMEIRQLCESC